MTYQIIKEIRIHHEEDGWDYLFKTDEYGTVSVVTSNDSTIKMIHIPKDCIQHFIDVLESFK